MTSEIKIPEVGESITEVQISEWLKAEGDTVKQNEPLAVIDSEKTTFELPAPQNGRLLKILRQAGDTVKVGEVVAQIAQESEAVTGKTEEKVSAEPSVVKDSGEAKGSEICGKPKSQKSKASHLTFRKKRRRLQRVIKRRNHRWRKKRSPQRMRKSSRKRRT
jgi:2-oxoglutarate dehydrogenase E2 component (dihydrolipoamide succinyltransferase)